MLTNYSNKNNNNGVSIQILKNALIITYDSMNYVISNKQYFSLSSTDSDMN